MEKMGLRAVTRRARESGGLCAHPLCTCELVLQPLLPPSGLCWPFLWLHTRIRNPSRGPEWGWVALAMRTSSHLLAAVRKREAMLLESVYSRSFCWKRASYLEGGYGRAEGIIVVQAAPGNFP